MDNKELNIKSSTIEKGFELAKDFLGKLIGPTVEELGLLISDNIKFVRFKNQVKILLRAKEYVEKRNLKIKEIPVKILVPLLENSSLEDDDDLQDKWAKMLTNLVDSEVNLQSQIFPYLLGQISLQEFNQLKELSEDEVSFENEKHKLDEIRRSNPYLILDAKDRDLKDSLNEIEQYGLDVNLEGYEIANLIRLGLIREMPKRIIIDELKRESWSEFIAEYVSDKFGYRVTELGKRFLEICEFKGVKQ